MKKIFLFLATVALLVACDPVQEDISMGNSITAEQLKEMCIVKTDKASSGKNGNVITCSTSAPVSAAWNIAGKDLAGNHVTKKVKLGQQDVVLTALCGDGTELKVTFPLNIEEITDPLTKYYIYGDPAKPEQQPFQPGGWDAAAMRFSDNEGKYLPYLSDEVYWGFKTLIFVITDATDDCAGRIMNGWWSARYDGDKDVKFTNGLWELPLTEPIAKDCASKKSGGEGKDLDLMVTSGSCTINSIYYEE